MAGYPDVPVQRVERDVQTLHQRALIHPNPYFDRYGRILGGQQPTAWYR